MTFKPVGIDEGSLFPPRVEARLSATIAEQVAADLEPVAADAISNEIASRDLVEVTRGVLPAGTDLNTLHEPANAGVWELSVANMSSYTNLPRTDLNAALLEVIVPSKWEATQRITQINRAGEFATRSVVSPTNNTWSGWNNFYSIEKITPTFVPVAVATLNDATDLDTLIGDATTSRKTYRRNTPSVPAGSHYPGVSDARGVLDVWRLDADNTVQTFTVATAATHVRTRTTTVWGAWAKLVNANDVDTALSANAAVKTMANLPTRLANIRTWTITSFVQDNITTDKGIQYAVWNNTGSTPVLGKRTLPFGAWATTTLPQLTESGWTAFDGHRDYVVAVSSDGYVHVSGNHHNDPIRYTRTVNPGDLSAWVQPGMVGDAPETSITYPVFVRMPNGELLFFFRDGISGNGDLLINAWDTTTKTWKRRSIPLQGTTPVSPDESPYPNHVAVDSAGIIHLFYVWRETDNVVDTHDICYIRSADNGATWTDIAGTVLVTPITPSTSPTIITAAWADLQFSNQSGADVDDDGHPHAAWWMLPTGNTTPDMHHVWHDGAAWHDDIVFTAAAPVPNSVIDMQRPAVLCHGGRTFILYYDAAQVILRDITPGKLTLPPIVLVNADLGFFEPTYDTRAVNERGELFIMVSPVQPYSRDHLGTPDTDYASVWGGILRVDLARVEQLAYGQ